MPNGGSPPENSVPGRGLKIVVTGPFAAGKTTLIGAVSEVPVLATESRVTDGTRPVKPHTTVAMDFGRLTLGPGLVLNLYGTPGQQRFEFMWDVLSEGMLGYILVVDGSRPQTWPEAAAILTAFRALSAARFVVAVNRSRGLDPSAASRLHTTLALGPTEPVVPCDVTDRDSVKTVLLAVLQVVADARETAPVRG